MRPHVSEYVRPDQGVDSKVETLVETMGLEPTTPCLQIRPTRTATNDDELLWLIRRSNCTAANRGERQRTLPFCNHGAQCVGSPQVNLMHADRRRGGFDHIDTDARSREGD